MKIEEFVKLVSHARVTYDDKWLTVEHGVYSVYSWKPHQKNSKCLIETLDEEEAVNVLYNSKE